MDISQFKIGDTVFMDGNECEVVDIIFQDATFANPRLVVRDEAGNRTIVNPEDLHL